MQLQQAKAGTTRREGGCNIAPSCTAQRPRRGVTCAQPLSPYKQPCPSLCHISSGSSSSKHCWAHVAACSVSQAPAEKRGPTGINVAGNNRPTSPKGWEIMSNALRDAKVKVMSPQEVIFAQERGAVVIDVRPSQAYDKGHVPGAISVPFYQPISGWSPWQVARRVGYLALGTLNGTEVNPDFESEVMAAAPPDAKGPVILYCSLGGSLEASDSHQHGMQTRSLIACYSLLQRGYSNLAIMRDGYVGWELSGRDVEILEEVADEA